jgi:hypothetical protein
MFIVSDWCGGGWLSISEPLLVSGQVLTPRYLSRPVVDLQNLLACKSLAQIRGCKEIPVKVNAYALKVTITVEVKRLIIEAMRV